MGAGIYSLHLPWVGNEGARHDGKGCGIKCIVAAYLVQLFSIFIFQNLLMKRTCLRKSTCADENSKHGIPPLKRGPLTINY